VVTGDAAPLFTLRLAAPRPLALRARPPRRVLGPWKGSRRHPKRKGRGRALDCRIFWKAGSYEAPAAPTSEYHGLSPRVLQLAWNSEVGSVANGVICGRRCAGDGGLRPSSRSPQVPPHQCDLPQVGLRRLVPTRSSSLQARIVCFCCCGGEVVIETVEILENRNDSVMVYRAKRITYIKDRQIRLLDSCEWCNPKYSGCS
jgi:hypothetical protein